MQTLSTIQMPPPPTIEQARAEIASIKQNMRLEQRRVELLEGYIKLASEVTGRDQDDAAGLDLYADFETRPSIAPSSALSRRRALNRQVMARVLRILEAAESPQAAKHIREQLPPSWPVTVEQLYQLCYKKAAAGEIDRTADGKFARTRS